MKKLFELIKKLIATLIVRITTYIKKLHISPITHSVCNKILIDAVNETAVYQLAKKESLKLVFPHNPLDDPIERAFNIKTQAIGGDLTYISMPPGYGRLFPWPDSIVRCTTDMQADAIREGLDSAFVDQIVSHTNAKDRVIYKKCLTRKNLTDAHRRITGGAFKDSDGKYYICVTSHGRVETDAFTGDGTGAWEDDLTYQDYFDRPMYKGEYGRYKLYDGLYIVFLTTLDDRMWHSIMFGPEALTVVPLEKNLHVIFRRTPAGETERQPRGIDIGYEFELGAVADLDKCVVLEATKRLEKEKQ